MSPAPRVRQLRLVVTADDFEAALAFYRDVLGMPEAESVSSPGGRIAILDAGRATLEITDLPHAEYIDEVEVGRRVAGHIRVALEVEDAAAATEAADARRSADRARRAHRHPLELPQRAPRGARRAPAHPVPGAGLSRLGLDERRSAPVGAGSAGLVGRCASASAGASRVGDGAGARLRAVAAQAALG